MTDQRTSAARQFAILLAFLAVTFLAAALGAWATASSVDSWYRELQKPTWTPPGWIFSPVWTTLYFCMAVAAWLVWRNAGWHGARLPLRLYAVQLALNVGWSICFFGLRRPDLAFAEILILWVAIALTLVAYWRVSRTAGLLMVPYLAWSTFASFLNLSIWRLNA